MSTQNLSHSDLIHKLQIISGLYNETQRIQSKMNKFEPEDHYKRSIVVPKFPGEYESEEHRVAWQNQLDHTFEEAIESAERVHRKVYAPKKPVQKSFVHLGNSDLQQKQEKSKGLSVVGAVVAIFFSLGIFSCLQSGYANVLPVVISLALAGAATFLFFRIRYTNAKKAEEKEIAEARFAHTQQQKELMAKYEAESAKYEKDLQKFLKDYAAWRKIYLQSLDEEAEIEEKLEAERYAVVKKIYEEQYLPAEAALNEKNDLVTEEYLPALEFLIDLLKSGRADDLKEAINLYEDILYRERQLQMQRDQEAQRQHEENLRREAEERHHKEQMQFQKEQERNAAKRHQEELAQRERQAKADLEQRERFARDEQRRQNEERRNSKRCVFCAHRSTCRQQYYDGAYNCTGFTPTK